MTTSSGNYYLVVLEESVSDADKKRAKTLFDVYQINENVIVLYSTNSVPTGVVSDLLELDDEKVGIVFKLNGSYSGFYYSEFWDWLDED